MTNVIRPSVSSLVTLSGIEGEKPTLESLLLKQIEVLRKQLDKPTASARGHRYARFTSGHNAAPTTNPFTRTPRRFSADSDSDSDVLASLNMFGDVNKRISEVIANRLEELPRPRVRSRYSIEEAIAQTESTLNSLKQARLRRANSPDSPGAPPQSASPESQQVRPTDSERAARLEQERTALMSQSSRLRDLWETLRPITGVPNPTANALLPTPSVENPLNPSQFVA